MSASLKIAKFSLNDFFSFTEFSLNQTKQKKKKTSRKTKSYSVAIYTNRQTHTYTDTGKLFYFHVFFIASKNERGKLIVLLLILSDFIQLLK